MSHEDTVREALRRGDSDHALLDGRAYDRSRFGDAVAALDALVAERDALQMTADEGNEILAEIVASIEVATPTPDEQKCKCIHCRHSRGVARLVSDLAAAREERDAERRLHAETLAKHHRDLIALRATMEALDTIAHTAFSGGDREVARAALAVVAPAEMDPALCRHGYDLTQKDDCPECVAAERRDEKVPNGSVAPAEGEAAEAQLARIRALVAEQAEDEGLWGIHPSGQQPIVEAYLQQELRRLHAVIEESVAPAEGEA